MRRATSPTCRSLLLKTRSRSLVLNSIRCRSESVLSGVEVNAEIDSNICSSSNKSAFSGRKIFEKSAVLVWPNRKTESTTAPAVLAVLLNDLLGAVPLKVATSTSSISVKLFKRVFPKCTAMVCFEVGSSNSRTSSRSAKATLSASVRTASEGKSWIRVLRSGPG